MDGQCQTQGRINRPIQTDRDTDRQADRQASTYIDRQRNDT